MRSRWKLDGAQRRTDEPGGMGVYYRLVQGQVGAGVDNNCDYDKHASEENETNEEAGARLGHCGGRDECVDAVTDDKLPKSRTRTFVNGY